MPAFTSVNRDFDPGLKRNEITINLNDRLESDRVGFHAAISSDMFLAVLNEFQGQSFRIVQGKPKGVLVQWFLVSNKWSVSGFGSSWSPDRVVLVDGNLVFLSIAGTCCVVVVSQAVLAFLGFSVCLFPVVWIACSACQKYVLGRLRS
jgi:hypothetical protein